MSENDLSLFGSKVNAYLSQTKPVEPAKTARRSRATTVLTLAMALMVVIVFWFGIRVALNTQYPLLAVASESMEPTLNVGDLIIVKGGVNPCDIAVGWPPNGTIIVFHKPGEYETLIVHRAVQKENYDGTCRFRTRGDHNPSVDPWWVEENEIVGVVMGQVPWLGHVALFMRTPTGMSLVVLLFAALIFWSFFPSIEKRLKSSKPL